MAIRRSKQLLDELLGGQTLSPDDLNTLVIGTPDEDQFLDYKSGKQDRDKLKKTVRKWVLGFANAEGGTLILGVTEPERQNGKLVRLREVDGVLAIPANEVHDWATRLLSEFAGRFSPPPTILPVAHPKGSVLLVATNRAPQLIPRVEDGKVLYAIRIGDSTVDAPDFLIADLLLGRRNHPVLDIKSVRLEQDEVVASGPINMRFHITVENLGFVTAEDVEVGVISWSFSSGSIRPNPHLVQHLDLSQAPQPYVDYMGGSAGKTWNLVRNSARIPIHHIAPTIKPFESVSVGPVTIGALPSYGSGTVVFAIYVMPTGAMPEWYEAKCHYKVIDGTLEGVVKCDRVAGRKPAPSWDYP